MITPEELNKAQAKFFADIDWYIVEKIIMERLDNLVDVRTVTTKGVNKDEVFAEIMSRQKILKELGDWLYEIKMLSTDYNEKKISYE